MSTPTEPPPPFGHQLRPYFGFEAGYINLNNGPTFQPKKGVLALIVFVFVQAPKAPCQNRFMLPRRPLLGPYKAIPTDLRFIKLHLAEYLNPARHRMAKFLGAGPEEIVFVSSISHRLNTVLRNLLWNKGDFIITGA